MLTTNGSKITTFRDKTLDLLQNRSVKLPFKKISEDTGIGKRWLEMFAKNEIPNPSVNTIQTLYEYLSKKQLKF